MPYHEVKQGECMESIARRYGFFWETLWNHPKNANLKQVRKNPNVLLPSDSVFIPEMEQKTVSLGTNATHRFRKKGVPSCLKIKVEIDGEARANERYIIEIDGQVFSGTTDGDGGLEIPLPPEAKRGKLVIGEEEYDLLLGAIDPIDEAAGIQGRLLSMGYDCGSIDGDLGPRTQVALCEFQEDYDLDVTGELDNATKAKIEEVYGG